MGTVELTACPPALRAITWTAYVRCRKNGSEGTRYVSAKRPTPIFCICAAYPPTRASTLATFDDVSTMPERTWPACATGALNDIARMRGGSAGEARTTGGTLADGAKVTEASGADDTGAAVLCAAEDGCTGTYTTGPGVFAGVAVGTAVTAWTGAGAAVPGLPMWLYHSKATTAHATISAAAKPAAVRLSIIFIYFGQRSADTQPFPARKVSASGERKAGMAVTAPPAPTLSVVVPLYNEEGNVAPLLERIAGIVERLPGAPPYEIVLVNDGSTDRTQVRIREQLLRRPNLVLVNLSRNFGHQLAATAGLDAARGEAVILMDGDLQDPPELIERFVESWRQGSDVVYAVRRSRKGESIFKLLTARVFYRTIKRLTNVSIPVDTGDFRLMSRRVVEALKSSRERHRFLRGLVSWAGYEQIGIEYDRQERFSGSTKYPLRKMLTFAIDGITSFSDVPLRFASYLGFTVSTAAFIYALIIVIFRAFRLGTPEYARGWASTMVVILFLGGVQLIGIGILGEYLGRIYDEVKARPLYLVAGVERSSADQS